MAKREYRTVKLGPANYVVFVPLAKEGEAIVDKETMDFLMRLGLSPNWSLNGGHVTTSGRLSENRHVGVARVILNAGPGECVRYRDNNTLNLRLSNLYLAKGKATKRDRLYI